MGSLTGVKGPVTGFDIYKLYLEMFGPDETTPKNDYRPIGLDALFQDVAARLENQIIPLAYERSVGFETLDVFKLEAEFAQDSRGKDWWRVKVRYYYTPEFSSSILVSANALVGVKFLRAFGLRLPELYTSKLTESAKGEKHNSEASSVSDAACRGRSGAGQLPRHSDN